MAFLLLYTHGYQEDFCNEAFIAYIFQWASLQPEFQKLDFFFFYTEQEIFIILNADA